MQMQIGMWTEEMQKAFLFTDHNLTEQLSDEELEASSEVEKSAFTVAALKAARAKKAAEAIGWKSHQATPLTSHRSRELRGHDHSLSLELASTDVPASDAK